MKKSYTDELSSIVFCDETILKFIDKQNDRSYLLERSVESLSFLLATMLVVFIDFDVKIYAECYWENI